MAPRVPESGFMKADSRNLPHIDNETVFFYFRSAPHSTPETRNRRTERALRAEYCSHAIGYVQVKRDGDVCHIRADCTPETRVTATPYTVHCKVDEKHSEILEAWCDSCSARNDLCKHALAFVSWLNARSNEPSPTEVAPYWKKAALSKVGSSIKIIEAEEFKKKETCDFHPNAKATFANLLIGDYAENQCKTLIADTLSPSNSISIHHLLMKYKALDEPEYQSGEDFIKFCQANIEEEDCLQVAAETTNQASSVAWFSARYGRITASKVCDASRCKTANGSLVNSIIGTRKLKDTTAIARGKALEPAVLEMVGKTVSRKVFPSGFVMKKIHPIFGASPDGLLKDYAVEVKCPFSEKTFPTYFTQDQQTPAKKYLAQLQLQMYMCDKPKGLFCVAHPDFETSRKIKLVEVQYDESYVKNLMSSSEQFWISEVFPKLYSSML